MGGDSSASADHELIAGRYAVVATLGSGGMATVYRVEDQRTGKHLALKRMRSDRGRPHRLHDPAVRARVPHARRSWPTRASSRSTTTASTATAPTTRWSCSTAATCASAGQLPWREACALLCDVASSLAILHSRRLVHRDVSPRNVRCTGDGRAKLFDFGAMVPMGVPKQVVGTPPCVPPESAAACRRSTARADLYLARRARLLDADRALRLPGAQLRPPARSLATPVRAPARAGRRNCRRLCPSS